jgi:16S rRNA (guanine966-N2)-methyltransferase
LVPGAMVVVERGSRGPEPDWPQGLRDSREKKYGETVLWYVHAAQN